jgi:hypothetical protein
MVDKAVEQINGILKLSSPEERLKRQLEMQQLGFMHDVYSDYKLHPENYEMTAHGPVKIDGLTRIAKIAAINHTLASNQYLNKKINSGLPPGLSEAIQKVKAAQDAERQGVRLSPSNLPPTAPVQSAPATEASTDNSDDSDTGTQAVNDEGGVGSTNAFGPRDV